MKQIFFTLFCAVVLTGCSVPAKPKRFNNHYYMVGDRNCVYFTEMKPGVIRCWNDKSQISGYRRAMTDQDLMVYMHEQKEQREAYNRAMQSLSTIRTPVSCVRTGPLTTCY